MHNVAQAVAVPVFDPLLAGIELPFRAEFFPHGFPAQIASNSPLPLEAAAESWAGWEQRFDERPLQLRCLVNEGGRSGCEPPVFRAQRHLLTAISDAENFVCSDLVEGFSFGWFSQATAREREFFRYHFLEAMVYSLLDNLHLVGVHAAGVALEGRGVLLAGDSGAGKSSLAYACARRGWTYCSDDASSLVRRTAARTVLGNPTLFRFRESAGELFPEFRGLKEQRRSNGKPTIEVPTASLPDIRTAIENQVDYIVLLNRRDARPGAADLHPVGKQDARKSLFISPWPAELPSTQERREAVERLLSAELFEMRYRDLDAAVDRLERLVRGGF